MPGNVTVWPDWNRSETFLWAVMLVSALAGLFGGLSGLMTSGTQSYFFFPILLAAVILLASNA